MWHGQLCSEHEAIGNYLIGRLVADDVLDGYRALQARQWVELREALETKERTIRLLQDRLIEVQQHP
jgi:hypothetical protein